MTHRLAIGASLIGLTALAACGPKTAAPAGNATAAPGATPPAAAAPAAPAVNDVAALKAQIGQIGVDVQGRAIDKVAANFAPDAVFMAPGGPTLVGGGAIRAAFADSFADPAYGVALTADSVTVSSSGDVAYVVAHDELTQTDPRARRVVRLGQGLVVAEKKDATGAWKIEAVAATDHPARAE